MHTFKHMSDFSSISDTTVEVTTSAVTLDDIIEVFKQYLLAVGFQPENIKDYFYDEDNTQFCSNCASCNEPCGREE